MNRIPDGGFLVGVLGGLLIAANSASGMPGVLPRLVLAANLFIVVAFASYLMLGVDDSNGRASK